jgi:serine O-acetyltransferase
MTKTYLHSLSNPHDEMWPRLRAEASDIQGREPALASYAHTIVVGRDSFADALGHLLAEELANIHMDALQFLEIITDAYGSDPSIVVAAQKDLVAILERDPAATSAIVPFLFFKGFHALQSYRIAHWLWKKERRILACYLQSLISKRFAVDIHPAAIIGESVMMDHANGTVIGETSVVEDNVSFLHNVTLGGTGKAGGDRHPKIRSGVMIGAGATILGNIEVGSSARVAAGSVVLENVLPRTVVAGVPARVVGKIEHDNPSDLMDQTLS